MNHPLYLGISNEEDSGGGCCGGCEAGPGEVGKVEAEELIVEDSKSQDEQAELVEVYHYFPRHDVLACHHSPRLSL